MKMSQRGLAGVIILDLEGRLILGDGEQEFRDRVDELMKQGHMKILDNMNAVTYIDSAGVGMLAGKLKTLRERGGDMKLLNLTSRGQRLFGMMKLHLVFETFDNEDLAAKSFAFRAR